MLAPEELVMLKKAGRLAAQALAYGQKLVKKNISLLEVTEKVEQKIAQLQGELAFPVNMSTDAIAAHYAAVPNDTTMLSAQVLKLDVGVHINGWIADNALTIDLSGNHGELVNASRAALNTVMKMLKPGITLHDIGQSVEETITDCGFQPIRNLSGHEIGQYIVHTGLSIPSYPTGDKTEVTEGMIIAVEPFATTGIGLIKEHGTAEIFNIPTYKPVRVGFVRELVQHVAHTYKHMPFSRRALLPRFTLPQIDYALSMLKTNGTLRSYPPLVEQKNGIVSQAEHSFYVTGKKAIVLTSEEQ